MTWSSTRIIPVLQLDAVYIIGKLIVTQFLPVPSIRLLSQTHPQQDDWQKSKRPYHYVLFGFAASLSVILYSPVDWALDAKIFPSDENMAAITTNVFIVLYFLEVKHSKPYDNDEIYQVDNRVLGFIWMIMELEFRASDWVRLLLIQPHLWQPPKSKQTMTPQTTIRWGRVDPIKGAFVLQINPL